MLWTLLLLNEFDLIFHDDFSTTAKRYEAGLWWETPRSKIWDLFVPANKCFSMVKGSGRPPCAGWTTKPMWWEDPWLEGVPATAPPAARAVGLTLRDCTGVSNLSVTVAPPAEDRLGGLGNFERPDGGVVGWSAFNQAIAWEGIGREGGALRTVGPLNERYGGSGLERRFEVRAGTILRASVFGRTPAHATVRGTKNFGVLRVECLAEDGRVLEWREVRPVDAEQKSELMVSGTKQVVKCQRQSARFPVEWCWCLCNQNLSLEPSTLTISRSTLKIRICSFMKNLTK